MKTFLTFTAIVFAAASFTSANAQQMPFGIGNNLEADFRADNPDISNTEISLYKIETALRDGNTDLAASLAADAIAADPFATDRIVAFVVSKNQAAAPALMAQIQAKAPGQATAAITTIGYALPDNAAGNAILAQAAANIAPAAGGNNANLTPNINLPFFIQQRIFVAATPPREVPQELPQQTDGASAT